MRYLLTFYAVEEEWMALPEADRRAGIAEIGQWFAEHARSGKIVEGRRLARGAKTVRLGRVRKKDLPLVTDGPFIEAKELMGGYSLIEVKSLEEAIGWAKRGLAIVGQGTNEICPVMSPEDFAAAAGQ